MITKYVIIFIFALITNLSISLAIIPPNVLDKINSINIFNTNLDLLGEPISKRMLKDIISELKDKNKIIHLKSLNLTNCDIHELPSEIYELSQLKSLNLSNNQLTNISPEIEKLSKLEELSLYSNKLKNLPFEIGNLPNLKVLNLSRNQLEYIPSELGKLSNLQKLNLTHNHLTNLPPELGKLSNLTSLLFSSNLLLSIPSEIGNLSNLRDIKFSNNNLHLIPPELGKLSNLTLLEFSNNQLQDLPPELGNLSSLKYMSLKQNQLQHIPPELSKLSNLKYLVLDNNPIKKIDPSLKELFIRIKLMEKYKDLFILEKDKISHLVLTEITNEDFSLNKACYKDIKKKMLKVMEQVWPSISENKKSVILKNKTCNNLLKEQSENYPAFKYLSQSYIPKKLEKFSKNIFNDFLNICQEGIHEQNYFSLFKQALDEPLYGPILASYLMKNPLADNICGPMNMTFTLIENQKDFFIPDTDTLPSSFGEKSKIQETSQFPYLGESTAQTYIKLFSNYRRGIISSKSKKGLTGELSLLPPYGDESTTDSFVWRKANTSFENVDFCNLKEGQCYVEPAPTCTTEDESLEWYKNRGLIRVKLAPDFNSARLIKNLPNVINLEQEVLFPPNSCFQYTGSKDLKKTGETIYDFILVPWTKNTDYGCYSRKLALQEANKYYGREYKINSSFEKIIIGIQPVARPNHGLTHGARQAYMALDLIKFLSDNEQKFGELGSWANKIRGDEKKQEIIFLMALHFRAARLSETNNYFPEYVAHMEKILKKSQLETNPEGIKSYANLLSEKPNLDSNDKKFMMMILDVSHRTDHLRQAFWNVEASEKDQKWVIGSSGFQNEENQKKIIDFMQARAEVYLEATGVYNVKKFGTDTTAAKAKIVGSYAFTNPDLFAELENNPAKLYQVMQDKMLK